MKTVIKAVNKIEGHGLSTRLFKKLGNENGEAFERLLLHTKVRWLSKKNCLARFYSLSDTVVKFLPSRNPCLAKEVISVRYDIANLLEIFSKFNELNLSFKGSKVNLIKMKSALSGFDNKLVVYPKHLARRECFQFLSLQQLDTNDRDISNIDVDTFSKHLQELPKNMEI